MHYPKISIVTPSYNQADFLEETICSILDQGYPNLEYVIVDGGSKDRSVEIIKKYEKYLSWWISEPDHGHGNAINKGFAHTTGEIMAWLNSDDKYKTGSFQAVAEIFSKFDDINWILGKSGVWNKMGEFVHEGFVYKNIYDYLLGDYAWIQQESTFWRRCLWDRAGGCINENYRLIVDGELWTRFFMFDDLWHVNRVLSGYRSHGTNRAQLYMGEVKNEMEQAISTLINRFVEDKNMMSIVAKLRDHESLYTKDVSLNYNVIDFTDNCWMKKKINYFAVKFAEARLNSSQKENFEELQNISLLKMLKKQIIIWGSGSEANDFYELLSRKGLNELVVGFTDNNEMKWGSLFCGKKVYSPAELSIITNDYAVLIGSMYYNEIGYQLKNCGLIGLNKRVYCLPDQSPNVKWLYALQCTLVSSENAPLFAHGFSFDDFTYARYSHMRLLNGNYIISSNRNRLDIHFCDLKAYQDAFSCAFIDQILPGTGANILEIGGGDSRVLSLFSCRHECWNIDKFKGCGNGPHSVPENKYYRIVQDYMGNVNQELPDTYFDVVFSISALEHVPEKIEVFNGILQDIDRVLKPGGYSFHLFNITIKQDKSIFMNKFVQYIFNNISTLNSFIPHDKVSYKDDIYTMSRQSYENIWFPITNKSYDDFGMPTSICVFWKKPIKNRIFNI